MKMPEPDREVLGRRDEIVAALRAIVPGEGVIADDREMRPYESDGLTAYRQLPMVVVLPETTAQVAAVLKYCHANGIRVVPRGSGTSLSGGALPLADGVLLGLGKFNRILDIDYANRTVTAQPGVTNLGITHAVQDNGFYYAPDPSSQIACSIGGNIAENSGGVHCLKYGLTTNNVLGVELVTIEGEVLRIGGKHLDSEGYDILGLLTGSEGLLAVVTEVTVRILRKPATARAVLVGFGTSEEAGTCVAAIIGAGIVPGGMEMMDNPAINAAEDFVNAGYPRDAGALLIVELDGPEVEVDFLILSRMAKMSEKHGLRVANVFHAGDGNLHPLILFDANQPGELERAEAFGADILLACVELGGVLTGEHGVGVEKRDLMGSMFSEIDLEQQQREVRLGPQGPAEPRQGVPDPAPLRRARPHARAEGPAAVPRHSAVLMMTTFLCRHPGPDRRRRDGTGTHPSLRGSRVGCAGAHPSGMTTERGCILAAGLPT